MKIIFFVFVKVWPFFHSFSWFRNYVAQLFCFPVFPWFDSLFSNILKRYFFPFDLDASLLLHHKKLQLLPNLHLFSNRSNIWRRWSNSGWIIHWATRVLTNQELLNMLKKEHQACPHTHMSLTYAFDITFTVIITNRGR